MQMSPRDMYAAVSMLQSVVIVDRSNVDGLEITFHTFIRTSTGSNVARHFDNAGIDPWAENTAGSTVVEKVITVPCSFIPKVETTFDVVQEGYSSDSDLEVWIATKALDDHGIPANDIRNRFEFVTIPQTQQTDLGGRPDVSLEQSWDITSIRPCEFGNRLIGVILGLALREPDTSLVARVDQ